MAKRKRARSTHLLTVPNWNEVKQQYVDGLLDENAIVKFYDKANYFCHYEINTKDCRKAFDKWLKEASGWDADDIKLIKVLSDSWLGKSTLQAGYIWSKVGFLPQRTLLYWNDVKKDYWIEKGTAIQAEKKESAEKPKVVAIRPNFGNFQNHVDMVLDGLTGGTMTKTPNIESVVDNAKLNKKEIEEAYQYIEDEMAEWVELVAVREQKVRSEWDEQLVEGYSNVSKPITRTIVAFFEEVKGRLLHSKQKAKVIRIRRKRPVDKNKLVRKLKHLPEHRELNIKSENPVDIIGASEVWYYDVKRKRLGVYASEYEGGLSVKGTSIDNYDTTKSYEKTCRKADIQVPAFMEQRKNSLHKYMDSIRGKKMAVKTRMQPNSVLLKIL